MIKKKRDAGGGQNLSRTDEAQVKAAVAFVSERYAEGANVVATAYEIADDFGVSASEILSHMGQRGGNVAARNRQRAPPRARPNSEPSGSDDAALESDAKDEEE